MNYQFDAAPPFVRELKKLSKKYKSLAKDIIGKYLKTNH